MKLLKVFAFALCTVTVPSICSADTYYILIGQSNANTTVDSSHYDLFAPASLDAACSTPSCNPQVFTVPDFDVSFAWTLAGGAFSIKSNSPQADITFTLFDSTAGTTAASATVSAGSVTNSYTPTDFIFSTPVALTVGDKYYATLTSTTGTNGNHQYDVKGTDSFTINSQLNGQGTPLTAPTGTSQGDPTSPVPEPSTWSMLTGVVLLATGMLLKRKWRTA